MEEKKVVALVATVIVVPRTTTAAGAAAEATDDRVWTSCARFCFHRYGKNGTGPVPAPAQVDILRRRARRISDLLPRTVAGISQFAPGEPPFVRAVDEGQCRQCRHADRGVRCEGRVRTFEFVVRFAPLCSLMLDVACVGGPDCHGRC